MDFGKLTNISAVDFSLPKDPPQNGQLLQQLKRSALQGVDQPRVYVGAPVWSRKEWIGKVYPAGTKPQDFLRHYSHQFNCIELNVTHYQIPDRATIQSWKEASPPGFRFCPKIPQSISHEHQLQGAEDRIQAFAQSMLGLGDRLGSCFLQLPPGFTPAQLSSLRHFIEVFPRQIPLAVEFRHPAWFSDSGLRLEAARLLEDHGVVALMTDVAGRRDVLHMTLTVPRVMIRFVGNGLHPTDYSRVDEWVQRLKSWMRWGLEEVYFFVHQPEDQVAPDLIRYFVAEINRHCGSNVADWTDMNQGEQMSLFA